MEEPNETATPPVDPTPNKIGVRYRWLRILAGLTAAAVAMVATLSLSYAHLSSRPVDLRSHFLEMTTFFESALEAARIDSRSIERIHVEEQFDDEAEWSFVRYNVTVPPELSIPGVTQLIQAKMRSRGIGAAAVVDDASGTVLLSFKDRAFAEIHLQMPAYALWDLEEADNDLPPLRLAHLEGTRHRPEDPTLGPQGTSAGQNQSSAPPMNRHVERPDTTASESEYVHEIMARVEAFSRRSEALGLNAARKVQRRDYEEKIPRDSSHGERLSRETRELALRFLDGRRERRDFEGRPYQNGPFRQGLDGLDEPIDGVRVAIILDDGGYGGPVTDAVLSLPPFLTLSILPNTPHAEETSFRAAALGFEVMLHMPMESDNPKVDFPGRITGAMTDDEIHALTAEALRQVPHAQGINNHTGSKFTADAHAMTSFLSHLGKRSLYFIDSLTSPNSVAYAIANDMGIPTAVRDVFLDNEQEEDYIRAMFQTFISLAKGQGKAIAICHFRPTTVRVLQEILPRLHDEGIRVVHVSELVQ